jgi:hypothetical protein
MIAGRELPCLGIAGDHDVSTLFRTQHLMSFSCLFIDPWREVALRCMTALPVTEPFAIFKYCCGSVFVRVNVLQRRVYS